MKKINNKIKIIISILLVVSTLFCLTACNDTKDTTYDIIKTTKMNNFTHLNEKMIKSDDFGNVVMIGDSIVELYNTQEQFGTVKISGEDKQVFNRGISGDTSDKLLERIECNALNIKPSVLVVLVGTNDIGRGLDTSDTLNNIKQLIVKAKESGVPKIVIESVYPVNKSINSNMVGSRKNSVIIDFNNNLKQLTIDEGVEYADVFSKLVDSNGNFDSSLTYDGLHPCEKGYDLITSVLLQFIK